MITVEVSQGSEEAEVLAVHQLYSSQLVHMFHIETKGKRPQPVAVGVTSLRFMDGTLVRFNGLQPNMEICFETGRYDLYVFAFDRILLAPSGWKELYKAT